MINVQCLRLQQVLEANTWQKSRRPPKLDLWVFLTSNTVKHSYCTGAQDSSLTLYMYPAIRWDSFTRFFTIRRSLFDNTTRRQVTLIILQFFHPHIRNIHRHCSWSFHCLTIHIFKLLFCANLDVFAALWLRIP